MAEKFRFHGLVVIFLFFIVCVASPQAFSSPAQPGVTLAYASGSASLAWGAEPSAAGYNVYRAVGHGGEPLKLNGSPLHETSFVDTDLPADAPCEYRVSSLVNGKETMIGGPATEAVWARCLGGRAYSAGRFICSLDNGDAIAVWITSSEDSSRHALLAARLGPDGNAIWQGSYLSASSCDAYSVDRTTDGGILILGVSLTVDSTFDEQWVMKIDSAGTMSWKSTICFSRDTSLRGAIRQTPDGGSILCTSVQPGNSTESLFLWVVKLTTNGAVEWQEAFRDQAGGRRLTTGSSVAVCPVEGGYLLGGSAEIPGAGSADLWLLKLKEGGVIEWQETVGGPTDEALGGVASARGGGAIISAGLRKTDNGEAPLILWLLKISANGAISWQQKYDLPLPGWQASPVQETTDGGFVLSTGTPARDGSDAAILKLDASGAIQWERRYRGIAPEAPFDPIQTSDGGFAVCTSTNYYSAGQTCTWVLKLRGDGSLPGADDAFLVQGDKVATEPTDALPADIHFSSQPVAAQDLDPRPPLPPKPSPEQKPRDVDLTVQRVYP